MNPCPECGSFKVYLYTEEIDASGAYGPTLLPKLNPRWLSSAKFRPAICKNCGLVRFYASEKALEKLKASESWELVD